MLAMTAYAHHQKWAPRADLGRGIGTSRQAWLGPCVGMELAHSKAFGWAKVTAEDLGDCIQAVAIAMVELVGVDEVERARVP